MLSKLRHINLAGLNLVLYSLLVIITPFIMLQHYLQGFIRHLSGSHINILGTSQPVVILIFASVLLCILVLFRKLLSFRNLAALLVLFISFAFGQWISDYYIDFKYYDLQNNWHYFAYFLFAFISWSFFKQKRISLSRILLYTWLFGLSISLFDELFQHGMSQRVFDLSDVAKDLWGLSTGLLILVFWVEKSSIAFKVRQEKMKDYFSNPVSCIVLLMVSSTSFILVSSLLTEKKYAWYVVLITFSLIGIVFVIIHNFKGWQKKLIIMFGGVLVMGQLLMFVVNRNNDFIFHNNFLTIYRGWCLPFFDVMIFPDKTIRYVDKKVEFNNTDKKVLMKQNPDVIIVGAGKNKEGGNGFPSKENTHFIFNADTKKSVQVIILDSRNACLKYNELSEKGIRMVMVLHKSL